MARSVTGRSAVPGFFLLAMLAMAGCGGGSSSISGNTTAPPTFSPNGGTYSTTQTVTIGDTTAGAVFYCTTDGTAPTTSSPQCGQPTKILKTEFLQAIAVAPGKAASAAVSAGYTIDLSSAPIPSFSPAGGTYSSAQTVTITDAVAGANIYYTVDGTVPIASSKLYTTPVTVLATQTLNAIAVASNFNDSGVASAVYTIGQAAALPSFSIPGGAYTMPQQVGISDATSGATIYYTTNGTTPTTSSLVYSNPITVSKSVTINALAAASSYANSAVSSATYTINLAPAPMPAFSLTLTTLSISDTAAGATIYYTTNGTTPTTSSTVYGGTITVTQGEVISAIAVGPNYLNSAVGTYVVNFPVAAAPAFSLSLATLTMSDATQGATIYYTNDGSAPTTSSTVYGGPIPVTEGEVIRAIAAGPGLVTSPVSPYTVALGPTPAPTFSPADGVTSTVPLTVTISDVAGVTIYYTIDGTAPTTGSNVYSGPLTVSSGTETIKAIGTASGFANSAVASATYAVAPGNASVTGTVLSGTTAVKGAQVQLYGAGQSGYGSSAATLLEQSVSTDSHGAFSFSYNCPASPNDLVYVVATGGDAGAGANSSLELMAALGPCGKLASPTSVVVNEATTIASAYALSAFITTAPNVGSSSTNYQGLANAFGTVNNLVNIATGSALTITPAYAAKPVPYLNISTVPQERIDTLANILNSCAGSNGSGCPALFTAATPTGGTAPTTTLQAAVNIAQNPGTSVASLFGLASLTGPFQPQLTAAPGDWTLALTFTGAGVGIPPGTSGISGTTSLVGPTLSAGLAIDAVGNVWVAASAAYGPGGGNGLSPFAPMLAEFNNLGAPLTPATKLSPDSTPVVTLGGYDPDPSDNVLRAIAIDQSGAVWLASEFSLLNVNPSLTTLPTPINIGGPTSLAIDGKGNAWTGNRTLYELKSNGTAILSGVHGYPPGGAITPQYGNLQGLIFDSSAGLWGLDGAAANGTYDVYRIDTSSGVIVYDAFPPPAVGAQGISVTLVADNLGNIYGCATGTGQSLNVFSSSAGVNSYPISTGRGCGSQLVLDGLGHIFSIQDVGLYQTRVTIDEFTTAGALLSPTNGYTGTSPGEPVTLNPAADISSPNGTAAAVDGSGNLWVLNGETSGVDANFNPQSGNVLVEYVGMAAPVATPTAAALTNGTLGIRP